MSAQVKEMTPHVLQNAGVVADGDQYAHSSTVVPAANMFAGLTKAERELAVTGLIQTAGGMLQQAVDAGEPADVMAGYKDQAAAMADLTKRLDVSKDSVLNAQVLQRRAERGLGVAIRAGQSKGTIRAARDGGGWAGRKSSTSAPEVEEVKVSPYDFASNSELYGDGRKGNPNGIYAMSDTGTDADFEKALTDARAEGNVSRANVVRKLKDAAEKAELEQASGNRESVQAWHEELAKKYPLPRVAFEAEGHQRHESADSFARSATYYGVKYPFNERSYARHVATSRERLNRASMSIEVSISVFEHLDMDTITPELADEALQRIDMRQLNFYIRSLKEISKNE